MAKRNLSRRNFLKLASAGTCGSAIHNMLMPRGGFMALAQPLPLFASVSTSSSVLVFLFLNGGNSYSLAPCSTGEFQDAFAGVVDDPSIYLPISATQGLHPALTAVKAEFDAGRAIVVNKMGYNSVNPNRSHDEATRIIHTGGSGGSPTTLPEGWGARTLCQISSAYGGVTLAGLDPFAMGNCTLRPLGDLGSFGEDTFWADGGGRQPDHFKQIRAQVIANTAPPGSEPEAFVRTTITEHGASVEYLQTVVNEELPVTFPGTSIGRQLRDTARLINAGPALNTRVFYCSQGGHDTHSNERNARNNLLTQLNAALGAFIDCMKQIGRYQDVTVFVMGEFGRTRSNGAAGNSDSGTDHGHAQPGLVIGGSVAGRVIGNPPSGADLSSDYIRFHEIDYRDVAKGILGPMGFNTAAIFPEPYASQSIQILA